jgi:micrococcal nuclease
VYEYAARILGVVDGDTIHAEVDLGLDVSVRVTLRLAGINAPEIGTPEGKAAKAWLAGRIAGGRTVVVRTAKDRKEKFGRYLATVLVDGQNLNEEMIAAGHAVRYP